ncbi:unnamed protein product [Brassica oleracea]
MVILFAVYGNFCVCPYLILTRLYDEYDDDDDDDDGDK